MSLTVQARYASLISLGIGVATSLSLEQRMGQAVQRDRFWLFPDNDEDFTTSSSDVLGVALCFKGLGLDQFGIVYRKSMSTGLESGRSSFRLCNIQAESARRTSPS